MPNIIIVGDLPALVRAADMISAMVAGANAEARRVAPCLAGSPTQDQLAEAKLVLVGAVKRWAQIDGGAITETSETDGPFIRSEKIDTRNPGGYTLWKSEIAKLQAICGADGQAELQPRGSFPKAQAYPDPALRRC